MAEDDEALAEPLKDFFEDHGLEVIHTGNGGEILSLFETFSPDLVLLDIILPEKTGFEAIKEIREKNLSVPIVLMTGSEIDTTSEIKGYNLGAINYIRKPVLPQVLLAVIRNLLSLPKDLKEYRVGEHQIMIHNTYVEINDCKIKLRDKDAMVFRKLLDKKGRVVERRELLIEVWKEDNYFYNNRLDVSINRLRKKLKDFGLLHIRSLYGQGYLLEEVRVNK